MLRRAASLLILALELSRAATGWSADSALKIEHTPHSPKSGEPVTLTAQINPNVALTNLVLHLQVVEPGNYLRRSDAAFSNSWQELSMQLTSRKIATATIPVDVQQHRRLIRYFISFNEKDGNPSRIPSVTNECPNFAYFVYDGVPAFTGASQPKKTPPLTFPADFMKTLPTYHLIARDEDVAQSQWDGGANKKRFFGTLIYDGEVYDHVQFHNRGKASTYVAGKNKWGFKFNDGAPFHDRDLWGRPTTWKGISLTACASPWAQVNRGMAGMDEAVSFRAYQLAGVPSASTHWIQFRVISHRDEVSAKSQYEGDEWGLYQVVQEPSSDWLREQHLPDGDIYTPETGVKHHAKDSPTNDVLYQAFMNGSQRDSPESWWRTNLDLPNYYTFHALNRALGNVDVRPGANHYLYREPDGRWCVVPWDLDMMFIAKTHQPGVVDQTRCLDVPALKREYKNRAREVLDLFCSDARPDGGQIGQLVDELARFLTPTNFDHNWPELDMVVWNYHPRSNAKGAFYQSPVRDGRFGGEWTRTLESPDFAGFCKYIVDYCTDSRPEKNYAINDGDQRGYGFGYLTVESRDLKIPETPTIGRRKIHRSVITPWNSDLNFGVSDFKSPTNATFASLQWRIGEISAPGLGGYVPGQPRKYEIEEFWRSEEIKNPAGTIPIDQIKLQPQHTYRVRARYEDNTGRWSHWSEPVQFVAH